MVPEETYGSRIAQTVQDETYNVEWLLVMSGSNLHADDIGGLLKRIDSVSNIKLMHRRSRCCCMPSAPPFWD